MERVMKQFIREGLQLTWSGNAKDGWHVEFTCPVTGELLRFDAKTRPAVRDKIANHYGIVPVTL